MSKRSVVLAAFVILSISVAGVGRAFQTERIVFVVIDGPRDTEFFEDPDHTLIPHIWNELRPLGYVSHAFYNHGETLTVPGHASMGTGTWQTVDNAGGTRPDRPLIWEYFRDETGAPEEDVVLVTHKASLRCLSFSRAPGYGPADSATVIGPTWNDWVCVDSFEQYALEHAPVISMICLGKVDLAAHSGFWHNYVEAIRRADDQVRALWEWVEATPGFAGRTAFFVTADHGRHRTDFSMHGDDCDGCRHLPFLAIGPDFQVGVEDWSTPRDLLDMFETAAVLLGLATPGSEGVLMSEILNDATGVAPVPRFETRLLVYPCPARDWTTVRLRSDSTGESRWLVRMVDAGGRCLWRGESCCRGGEIRIRRPSGTRCGMTWVQARPASGGEAETAPLVWLH